MTTTTHYRRSGSLIIKDPQSIEPRGFDWSEYLDELGSSVGVQTSTWSVSGSDENLTLTNDSILSGAERTQVFLTGGTVGVRYTVTNTIVTNSSPSVTDERSFFVLVTQR